jgi:acetyl esterase/lipase
MLLVLSAAAVRADPFSDWDKNHDGQLTRDELPAPLRNRFAAADANRDGVISREEGRALRERNRAGRPAQALRDDVVATLDLPYADNTNPAQRLDLYLPKTRVGEGPLPVIVFIHGGAWQAGSKAGGRGHLMPFVTRGRYAGVSVEYRLSREAQWPAQLHDCKAAIRWVKAHAREHRLDPNRIAVWGTSAGGHLVAMLGVTGEMKDLEGSLGRHTDQTSRVTCVADYFGPANLLTMGDFPSTMKHNAADSPESKLIGGPPPDHPDKARAASPFFFVTKGDAPVFIAHGTADPLVPYNQSEVFARALREAGVPVYLQTIEQGGHGGFEGPKLNARLEAFFAHYLLDSAAAIDTGKLKVRE